MDTTQTLRINLGFIKMSVSVTLNASRKGLAIKRTRVYFGKPDLSSSRLGRIFRANNKG